MSENSKIYQYSKESKLIFHDSFFTPKLGMIMPSAGE